MSTIGSKGVAPTPRERHVQQALRRSEARYRALVEATCQAVWSRTPDGVGDFVAAQKWWEQVTGQPASKQEGDGWLDVVHPQDRARAGEAWQRSVATGEPYEVEYRVLSRIGEWRYVHSRAVPVLGSNGTIVEWVGALNDVTERRVAEEELRQSEARFRWLTSAGFIGVIRWDLERSLITDANDEFLRITGYDRADLTAGRLEFRSLTPPEWRERTDTCVRQLRESGASSPYEKEYFRKDGSRVPVVVVGVRFEDAANEGMSFVIDLSERRRTEEELRKQSVRMRLLWEAASVLLTTEEPDAMMRGLFAKIAPHFELDVYFNFMVNDEDKALRLESYLGIPPEIAEGIRRLEFGQAVCGAVAQSRQPITATWIQQSDDPRVQLVKGFGVRAYACNPLLAGDVLLGTLSFASRRRDDFTPDELDFLRTICRYVTVAYERLGLVRELREADRKKDDFIALLAHELRNPLAPIRNGLHVLRLARDDQETAEMARTMMDRQLSHMVRLIDDLLDVSRISRNKMQLRRSKILLADVVNSAVETVRPLVNSEHHELTVELPAAPIYLDADLTRLAQVVSNLLSNSVKYTPAGGRIALSAERRGPHAVLSVRDNGIGIPTSSMAHIFNMFSQVDRPIERSAGGLGIGLALVKGLVEMHGGTVAAFSQGQGLGSTFTISLPILATPTSPNSGPADDAPPAIAPRRFLVVDDNHDGAESLAQMLSLLGHEVRTAFDGLDALERAESFRPDVILMDVGMPRLNGLDATKRIRSQSWGRSMTIIALTGWGQDGDRERSREAGCDTHLTKPLNLADLEKVLR